MRGAIHPRRAGFHFAFTLGASLSRRPRHDGANHSNSVGLR